MRVDSANESRQPGRRQPTGRSGWGVSVQTLPRRNWNTSGRVDDPAEVDGLECRGLISWTTHPCRGS